ncbi:MAG: hypothetical protein ABI361_02315 [Nitrososphaera sp.]
MKTTTDADLLNSISKEGIVLPEGEFNKTLLDLEIFGLIRVSWETKEKRRVELVASENEAGRNE